MVDMWWGSSAQLSSASRVSLLCVSRRVGIPESARRKIWFCLDEAVRAPQPVTPARHIFRGPLRASRDSPQDGRSSSSFNARANGIPTRLQKKPAADFARVYFYRVGLCGPTCMDFILLSQRYYYSAGPDLLQASRMPHRRRSGRPPRPARPGPLRGLTDLRPRRAAGRPARLPGEVVRGN
jgi:hypothetical protein